MGRCANGLHLTRRGRVWLYNRRRPKAYEDVEPKKRITFSLGTTDFHEARILAAQHTVALDRRWAEMRRRGISLASQDAAERHAAAVNVVREMGFSYAPAAQISDSELIDRLRVLRQSGRAASRRPVSRSILVSLRSDCALGV